MADKTVRPNTPSTFAQFWVLKKGMLPSTRFSNNKDKLYDSGDKKDAAVLRTKTAKIQKILPKLCRVLKIVISENNEDDEEFEWNPHDYTIIVNDAPKGMKIYCYKKAGNLVNAVYDEEVSSLYVMWMYNILTHIYTLDKNLRIHGPYYEFFANKYNSRYINWYKTYNKLINLRKYFVDLVDTSIKNHVDVQVQPRVRGAYDNELKMGEWIEFHQDGMIANVLRATVFLKGKIHGYRIHYDRGGSRISEGFYKNGIPCGRHYQYEDGLLRFIRIFKSEDNSFREREYMHGKCISNTGYKLYKQDDPNAQCREIDQYARHGLFKVLHVNNKLRTKGTYKMGALDGKLEEWYSNGSIRSITTFKDGFEHGTMYEYHYNDKPDSTKSKIKFQSSYEQGIRKAPFSFNETI